jgi:hypothetical protein
MICYRNRWWCPHTNCKKFGAICDRSYTQKVAADARRWWGVDEAPVDLRFEKPKCFEEREDE